ncbi:zinc-binding alcohol dehydrogenase family protein [Sphingomonas glacialis]|uniref:Zinc-binding alcohol dehydrogenase family protein n=1 Tax=Sphingomonas glacialis TaxID=658225 RepID=A0A502FJB5_9SPHN|nr:zinc-binding alcohol dehydrogenase family protein [Sphingomonas glacialis]TPG49484.1 zinc-binding alcohol dehydrogenase family protein [Sphingomonas glacialis]
MKAIVCQAPYHLVVSERPEPVLGADEVLVRIRRVGLCGTDYHIYAGRHPYLSYPRVMGHELGGEIEAVPAGSSFAVGQRVAINPYLSCGSCIACGNGKPNACVNISVLGVHADGGMCERIAVPESAVIDATGLSLDQAAMIEFLAIGAHAVARARVAPGQRVLVVGAGPIGIAAGLFARLAGASVMLIDTRATRLEYARTRLGFDDSVVVDDNVAAALGGRTGGTMYDTVFDATGVLAAMTQSLAYVAHGGSLVLVGVAPGDLVFADPEFHKRETTLLASRNALASDFAHVIASIKAGKIPIDALHTDSFAADDMPERLPELIAGADHVLKAIASF